MAATFPAAAAAAASAANPNPSRRLQALALSAVAAYPPRRSPGRSPTFLPLRRPNAAAPPLRVASTDPKIVNGEDFPPMKDLIESYKKAFLDGNEDVLYEIEKAIAAVEIGKNKAAAELESITAEITSGKTKLLRVTANLENFRKQTEKDRAKFTSNIQVEVVQSLLPLVDSFENAKQDITPETDKEHNIVTSYQGIYKQFVETLRSLGVGVVETVGKPFDPSIHEAVAREESVQFKAGIVSHEIQRGFLLRERLLRPATVKVSAGSSVEETKDASESVENPTSATAAD